MGMDVYGEKPKSKTGEYFRNNCWWWRPLWNYVCAQCNDILTERDHRSGHYNDGHLINAEKTELISARLKILLKSGDVARFEEKYTAALNALPDEVCRYCHGTGARTDMKVADGCNACHGKGTVRPEDTWYPFEEQNVKKFMEFCKESGGFRIS